MTRDEVLEEAAQALDKLAKRADEEAASQLNEYEARPCEAAARTIRRCAGAVRELKGRPLQVVRLQPEPNDAQVEAELQRIVSERRALRKVLALPDPKQPPDISGLSDPDRGYYVRETEQDGYHYVVAYFPSVDGKRVVCQFIDSYNKQLVETMFAELMKWRAKATEGAA